MNSYIWLSLETLKEVEITEEGLVIHHHPDMCPNTAAPAWEKQTRPDGNWPAVHAQKGSTWLLGSVFFFRKNNCSHSCIVKERRRGGGWEALEWQLGRGGGHLVNFSYHPDPQCPHTFPCISLSAPFLRGATFPPDPDWHKPQSLGPQAQFAADPGAACLLSASSIYLFLYVHHFHPLNHRPPLFSQSIDAP